MIAQSTADVFWIHERRHIRLPIGIGSPTLHPVIIERATVVQACRDLPWVAQCRWHIRLAIKIPAPTIDPRAVQQAGMSPTGCDLNRINGEGRVGLISRVVAPADHAFIGDRATKIKPGTDLPRVRQPGHRCLTHITITKALNQPTFKWQLWVLPVLITTPLWVTARSTGKSSA